MTVELHTLPFRHYKIDGSWTANKQRIVSVTTVLGGDDHLTEWAAQQAVAAGTEVAERWLGMGHDSLLSFPELCRLTALMPDQVRDAAATRGTALHSYFSAALYTPFSAVLKPSDLSYGYCDAISMFMSREEPVPISDHEGLRIERAVGDAELALAGTYDAQVWLERGSYGMGRARVRHRLDLKSSNTVQPKHFAQLAAYERMAVAAGEELSDFLTVVHIDATGNYALHSIGTGSREHETAERMFDSYLHIYRGNAALSKVIR